LFIAFVIAGVLTRFTGIRAIVFGIAGALALFVLFTVMKSLLGTVGIFGARGPAGLAAQMAVGAVAGVLFARLTKPPGIKPTITTTATRDPERLESRFHSGQRASRDASWIGNREPP
jgi:hypothetical protein